MRDEIFNDALDAQINQLVEQARGASLSRVAQATRPPNPNEPDNDSDDSSIFAQMVAEDEEAEHQKKG